MLNGFKEETYNLSLKEMEIYIPWIINGLETKKGKQNAITSNAMIAGIYELEKSKSTKPSKVKKINPARMRVMIRYIRMNRFVTRLISSNKGYWIEPNDMVYKLRVDAIFHRASANYYLAVELKEQMQIDLQKTA